jgi:hypothetical protein
VPAYCKINGTLEPALNFEVRLPNAWNGSSTTGAAAVTTVQFLHWLYPRCCKGMRKS